MFWLPRAQRKHALVALVAVSALVDAPIVAAEIFKCATKDGGPLYQNFPCSIDSVGSLPSNPPVAKAPLVAGNATPEKSKTKTINVASTSKSTLTGEPRIGMTTAEVRALLGEPEEMVDDEPADGGRVSIWRYADGRSVQFDRKHRVLEVQR